VDTDEWPFLGMGGAMDLCSNPDKTKVSETAMVAKQRI
jgi:hypothetical protein